MRALLTATLACVLCFGESPTALAQTTYYVSPAGDDGAAGTSFAKAFRTFARGIEALAAGDSLLVDDGVYREAYLVIDSLVATPERPTVIKSINNWGAKIEGAVYHAVLLKILACDHIVVEGFEVYHPGDTYDTDWVAGLEAFESNYVTFRDNYVHDCGCGGLGMRTGDYFVIERNVAAGNARHNVYNCSGLGVLQPRALDDAPGPHIVIRDNVAFGNECRRPFLPMGFTVPTDGNGIILDDFEQTHSYTLDGERRPPYRQLTLIENNLSFGNGGAGIKSYETANVIFRNNTAYHNNEVLSEQGGGLFSEIGAEAVAGHIEMYGNIAVKAFGRPGNATYFKPKPGEAGKAARLRASDNLIVGLANMTGVTLDPATNMLRGEDEQSYPRFVDPRDTVPEDIVFRSVDDFRQYFGLRQNSPAVDALAASAASERDLGGVARPVGAAADLGAYEGAVATAVPIAADPVLTAELYSTPQAMVVDGKREGFYRSEPHPIAKDISGTGNQFRSARWYGAYDADALYVFVESSQPLSYGSDVWYDRLDREQVLVRVGGVNDLGLVTVSASVDRDARTTLDGARLAGGVVSVAADSYNGGRGYEMSIPWTTLGVASPSDAYEFSIEVVVQDTTRTGEAITIKSWRNGDLGREGDPAQFGRAILRVVAPPASIYYAEKAPRIDGHVWGAGDWGSEVGFVPVPIERKIAGSVVDEKDLSASWIGKWDEEALYLFIWRYDDAESVDDGEAWYKDDGVEVYLDLNNAKTFGGYDEDDRQISIGIDASVRVTKGMAVPGAEAAIRRAGNAYIVEVALPWAGLGAEPAPGKFIGLDVHVIDDDDGGSADAKLSWFSEIDQAHSNARLFGTAALAK